MTAEIAILNKSSIALAADSAVTIGEGGSAKIYNTVNKIFELSETQPLGLMIYGSLSYMGLPMEVLVKEYRRRKFSQGETFKNVQACTEDFARYLENDVPFLPQNEEENVRRIVYWTVRSISNRCRKEFFSNMIEAGKFLRSKANGICQDVIGNEASILTDVDREECFTPDQFDRKYQVIIDDSIASHFTWLRANQATKKSINKLVRLTLHRAELSRFRTGIVVAGFGENEICPTLCSFEMDGIVNGKLKRSSMDLVDIDRGGPVADVKAFAQREMVERFLQGVDPSYDQYVQNRLEDAMKKFAELIFQGQNLAEHDVQDKVGKLAPVIARMKEDFVNKSDKHKENEFKDNVLNMVQFMPNQELATLAESLIDLTSLKRHMSAERETVGGQIDVAIISRSDGFVWIKRKHYFPPELNPRFFHRHYEQRGTRDECTSRKDCSKV